MLWSNLFAKTADISADKARKYISETQPASLQLLDVRQPKEYQEQHIPGAILIPLNELKERTGELATDVPTIVYCRSGMRSKAGCQILVDNDFDEVHNLAGGILGWNGATAFGGEDFGIDFFVRGSYASGWEMAYYLEKGLQMFYTLLAADAIPPEIGKLLKQMAQMEDGHMAALLVKSKEAGKQIDTNLQEPDVIEGGLSLVQLQTAFGDNLSSPESVIQLAMMFEAQACDLYNRLARRTESDAEEEFYQKMAAEEQKHLDKLTGELDNLL